MIQALRYHDISCGHRVVGHEGHCRNAHGHNYRVHFLIAPADTLDDVGRVLDFSIIKATLCEWLEQEWDHKFLLWELDPWLRTLQDLNPTGVVAVPFNPTAENMANHLLRVIGPTLLPPNVLLTSVKVEETRKCSAIATLEVES